MAISSPGIGSGLNIQSIVSQLVAVESQPVKLLQNKSSVLQTKVSAFGQIKSDLAAVQDAALALVNATSWDSKTFTSNNTSAITGSASSSALASSFSVNVTNLASGQSVKTAALSSSYTAPTGGTLSVQLGSWSADGVFTSGSSGPVSIDINAGDKLTTIADAINAKSTASGISATVVSAKDAAGVTTQQLLLRSTSTGVNSGFQITPSAGLEQFGYEAGSVQTPAVTDGTGAVITPAFYPTVGSLIKTQSAADAALTIDGVDVTSSTNTVADAVPGVTLNLLAKTTTAAQVTVGVDKDTIKAKIQAFQDAYNKLNTDLKAQTKYDATTKTGGPLLGDSTVTGLQSMLRSLVGATGPAASTIGRLSNLGIEIQADGSLKTNSAKVDNALQDTANVKAFFATSTGTSSGDGIAKRIYDFVFAANGVGGTVSTHSAGYQKQIDQNTKSIDAFNTHIDSYQKQLLAQYTALDKNMAKLNSLSTYVSQQISTWNKSG